MGTSSNVLIVIRTTLFDSVGEGDDDMATRWTTMEQQCKGSDYARKTDCKRIWIASFGTISRWSTDKNVSPPAWGPGVCWGEHVGYVHSGDNGGQQKVKVACMLHDPQRIRQVFLYAQTIWAAR